MRVVVAGHVCADLTPALLGAPDLTPGRLTEVGPLAIAPGGAVANTGLALAAMGDDVRADALVGPDPLAGLIRAALTAGGVNADRLRQAPPSPAAEPAVPGMDDAGPSPSGETPGTSYSIVVAGPGGDRAFWHHPGANRAFDGAAVDLAGAEALHVGYPALIGAGLDRGGRPLRDLLSRAAAGGVLTSLDTTTLDAQSPAAALDWTARLRLWLPVTDVFSPSADDLRSMLPEFRDATPAELAEAAIAWGAAVAAVSAGPAGLALACGPAERLARAGGPLRHLAPAWADARLAVPAAPLDRIVSTNGAGDTMSAGLLHGIGLGLAPAAAASLAARAAAARIQGRPLPHR